MPTDLRAALRDRLAAAFDAAWEATGEGFNGEYTSRSFTSEMYERMRDEHIDKILASSPPTVAELLPLVDERHRVVQRFDVLRRSRIIGARSAGEIEEAWADDAELESGAPLRWQARCPTCDRDGCKRDYFAILDPARTEAIAGCDAHAAKIWRARALAAEALVESYESPTCDHRHPCRCGSGGHPRRCERHPLAYDAHCAELNAIGDAEADAARWHRVAPLIDRLRPAAEGRDVYRSPYDLIDAVHFLLAATADRAAPEGDTP